MMEHGKGQALKPGQAEQDMYRAHITSIVNQIDSVDALRKIYTVAKTFLKLRQQEGAEHGNI